MTPQIEEIRWQLLTLLEGHVSGIEELSEHSWPDIVAAGRTLRLELTTAAVLRVLSGWCDAEVSDVEASAWAYFIWGGTIPGVSTGQERIEIGRTDQLNEMLVRLIELGDPVDGGVGKDELPGILEALRAKEDKLIQRWHTPMGRQLRLEVMRALEPERKTDWRPWARQLPFADEVRERADLRGIDFGGAPLPLADLTGAALDLADFSCAILPGAVFTDCTMHRARFRGARADRALFTGAQIVEIDFSHSSLVGADFTNAMVCLTSFSAADLRQVSFASADVEGCDFSNAVRS